LEYHLAWMENNSTRWSEAPNLLYDSNQNSRNVGKDKDRGPSSGIVDTRNREVYHGGSSDAGRVSPWSEMACEFWSILSGGGRFVPRHSFWELNEASSQGA